MRDAVVNAVVHADYLQGGAPIRVAIFEDRLEVESPGMLPYGLTVEDLHRGISKLRNRVIGRVFHTVGLIEQWGSGMQRMTTVCHDAGLPAPLLEEVGTRFRVTMSTRPIAEISTTDGKNHDILRVLARRRRSPHQRSRQGDRTHHPRHPHPPRAKLVERGLVREIGTSPQDPKQRYFPA